MDDYPHDPNSRDLARHVGMMFAAFCVRHGYGDDVLDEGTRIIEADPKFAAGTTLWRILDLALTTTKV